MRPIAKRLIGGLSAAAQADHGTAAQAERLALCVDNLNLAFYAQRSIVIDDDFSWHSLDASRVLRCNNECECEIEDKLSPFSSRGRRAFSLRAATRCPAFERKWPSFFGVSKTTPVLRRLNAPGKRRRAAPRWRTRCGWRLRWSMAKRCSRGPGRSSSKIGT